MAGTPEGGKSAAETNKRKYGKDFYKKIARLSHESYMDKPKAERKPRGFAVLNPEQRREVSSKGAKKRWSISS